MKPRVIYQSGRKPRRSGYITETLLRQFGSRQAALAYLEEQDRKREIAA